MMRAEHTNGAWRSRGSRLRAVVAGAGLVALLAGCGDEAPRSGGPLPIGRVYGETGLQAGQFSYPRAIDATEGWIVVIDKSARVQRIDPESGRVLGWFRMPDRELGKPTGVTIGATAEGKRAIYVPDTHYHRVLVYPEEGTAEGQEGEPEVEPGAAFGSYGMGSGEFIYPTDVAVLADERGRARRIYVSEYGGNDRISVFDGEYRYLFSFGSFGGREEEGIRFNRAQAVAVDPVREEVVVADACNHRLGRFTLDGELVGWVGSAGDGAGEFNYPYGICLLEGGEVLVAEYGGNRVQRIDLETGEVLGVYGEAGHGRGQILTPWGLSVLDDRVFLLDSGHDRVVSFRAPIRRLRVAGDGG